MAAEARDFGEVEVEDVLQSADGVAGAAGDHTDEVVVREIAGLGAGEGPLASVRVKTGYGVDADIRGWGYRVEKEERYIWR